MPLINLVVVLIVVGVLLSDRGSRSESGRGKFVGRCLAMKRYEGLNPVQSREAPTGQPDRKGEGVRNHDLP